uniref:Uncharacterized protein n=1 Tax=Cannabis sativa TaxID=3483 RepID=A0A803NRT0_CANSA
MRAATPQGELPSDGTWWVLRRRSQGEMAKRASGFSIDESQRTMSKIIIGTTKRTQLICSSAVSTASSDTWHNSRAVALDKAFESQQMRANAPWLTATMV